MSTQITAAFVEQFSSNVEMLAQQMESRFAGKVRTESQKGKTRFYEQLGATSAVKRTSRHADTPRVDSLHRRRAAYLTDYDWSDLVDTLDEVKLLIDPASSYARSAAMAFNRAKDDEIIAAATGAAFADKDGSGAVISTVLPAGQKVAVNYVASGAPANSGLTLAKLIRAKSLLSRAEYPMGSRLYIAHRQQQLDDLLNNVDQVANERYADVKALVQGEVNMFMGFEFVRSERLTRNTTTDITSAFAWVYDGLLLAVGQDSRGRIAERPDKNHATQVYYNMSVGSTRMQEEYVVEIACDESP